MLMGRRAWVIEVIAATALCLQCSMAVAKEPYVITGIGIFKCKALVSASKSKEMEPIMTSMFAWVQGWFSARNAAGPNANAPRSVGGTLSAQTLQGFLVSECEEHPEGSIYIAVDRLYDRLAEKGL